MIYYIDRLGIIRPNNTYNGLGESTLIKIYQSAAACLICALHSLYQSFIDYHRHGSLTLTRSELPNYKYCINRASTSNTTTLHCIKTFTDT